MDQQQPAQVRDAAMSDGRIPVEVQTSSRVLEPDGEPADDGRARPPPRLDPEPRSFSDAVAASRRLDGGQLRPQGRDEIAQRTPAVSRRTITRSSNSSKMVVASFRESWWCAFSSSTTSRVNSAGPRVSDSATSTRTGAAG